MSPLSLCGWAVWHLLWQGAIVALVAGAAFRLLRHHSPAARHRAALVSLGALLCGPLLTLLCGPEAISPAPARPRVVGTVVEGETAHLPSLPTIRLEAEPQSAAPIAFDPALWTNRNAHLFGGIWGLGTGLAFLLLAGAAFRIMRLRRSVEAISPERRGLIRRVAVNSPMVIGVLRPLIFLPLRGAEWSAKDRRVLLAHEIAHLRRRDPLANLFQLVIESLLWFHPATWWLSKRARFERELACDLIAARRCRDTASYVETLLRCERGRARSPRLGLGATGELLARARLLLGRPELPSRRRAVTRALLLVVLASCAGIAVEQPVLLRVARAVMPTLRVVEGSALLVPRGVAYPLGDAQDPSWHREGTLLVPPKGGLLSIDGGHARPSMPVGEGQLVRLVDAGGRCSLTLRLRHDQERGPHLEVRQDGHPATLSGLDAFATLP